MNDNHDVSGNEGSSQPRPRVYYNEHERADRPVFKKDLPQIVCEGRIKQTRDKQGEVIVFTIPLGFVKLICIVNIPNEGTSSAPVYVKVDVTTLGKPMVRLGFLSKYILPILFWRGCTRFISEFVVFLVSMGVIDKNSFLRVAAGKPSLTPLCLLLWDKGGDLSKDVMGVIDPEFIHDGIIDFTLSKWVKGNVAWSLSKRGRALSEWQSEICWNIGTKCPVYVRYMVTREVHEA